MAHHPGSDVWVVVVHGGDGAPSEVEGVFTSEARALEVAEGVEIDGVAVVDVEIVGRRIDAPAGA